MDLTATNNNTEEIRPDVLNFDDIKQMVPKLANHEKLVNRLLKWLKVDEVNDSHRSFCDTPGYMFCQRLLFDRLKLKLRIDNEELLNNLPQGAFITVSNHPFGALDGIALIYMIGSRRPEYKVMVNMILNKIGAMRPNFIAVDAWASNDPERRRQSVRGIREALKMLATGKPVGFFPAGAMSKIDWHLQQKDRPWQESVLQIIHRAKVPVIPIFFHGSNSWLCNFFGVTFWQVRSLMLPREVYRREGTEMHISIGDPISVEDQSRFANATELGAYLREKTYELRKKYK